MVTPVARREAAAHLGEVYGVSERRACQAIGVDRSSVRYRSRRHDDGAIRTRLRKLAAFRRRFGYRRLYILLRREGLHLNHKKLRFRPRNAFRSAAAAAASERWARELPWHCRRARTSAGRWISCMIS
jgi:hypothetical protein